MLPLPPPLPRQHGAWVMLALPLLLGIALTSGHGPAPWGAVPGFLLAFLANDALVQAVHATRRTRAAPAGYVRQRLLWGSAYLGGAGACFLALLILSRPEARAGVLAVAFPAAAAAAVYGLDSAFHRKRTLWSELMGMAGMSLAAPLMAAASGRTLLGPSLGAAAMAYAYCLSSVAFVRTYERMREAPRAAATICLGVHLLLFGGIALLAWMGIVPRWGPLAFLPVAMRVVLGLAWPPRDLRALGMRELWVATSFALLSVSSFSING